MMGRAQSSVHFYPRPPRGGRQAGAGRWLPLARFLPTPSARRATARPCARFACIRNFYPRPPRGGRQHPPQRRLHRRAISTHALREEGDPCTNQSTSKPTHFYPRPPRGGRPGGPCRAGRSGDFYPRPPRGGRRVGAVRPRKSHHQNFYPRPSTAALYRCSISTHALREEGDSMRSKYARLLVSISTHALREEGDRMSSTTKPLCA